MCFPSWLLSHQAVCTPAVESLAEFHIIRGVALGGCSSQFDVSTGGPPTVRLVCCASSFPFRTSNPPSPPPFPTHTLNIRSLVRSQIIELLLPHDLQHQNILPDRSTSALRPRKPRTQRRPDETCEEASKQVRDQLFFLFALTKRADDLRVCLPFSPTTQEPPPSTSRPSRHR